MKRDARIGLAVVLVLGLSVTLLVARALHKHANEEEHQAAASAEQPARSETPANEQQPLPDNANDIGAQSQQQELERFNNTHANNPQPANGTSLNPAADPNVAAQGNVTPVGNKPTPSPNANPGGEVVDLNNLNAIPNAHPANELNAGDVHGQPPAPEAQTYTVAAGDNPYKISAKVFGDGKYAKKIMDANPGVDPSRLKVGQKLKIPAIQGAEAHPVAAAHTVAPSNPTASSNAPSGPAKTYTVKGGDTLAAIAKSQLGMAGPKTIQKIIDANPGLDAKKLRVGATIKIPAAQ